MKSTKNASEVKPKVSEEKEVSATIDLGDNETTVKILSKNARLSVFDVISTLNNIASRLSAESQRQIINGNRQFVIAADDGTLLSLIPFASKEEEKKNEENVK